MKNKQSNRWFSSKQEQYVAKQLGGIVQPNSGAANIFYNLELLEKDVGRFVIGNKGETRVLSKFKCLLCGKVILRRLDEVKRGHVKSCGCLSGEKHNMAGTRFYRIWKGVNDRCYYKNSIGYTNYGARGITVCDRWKNSFLAFKEDMYQSYLDHVNEFGEKNTSIDRIDPNGNYEPSNCRWATNKEQGNNTRQNHYVTLNGETHTLSEWANITGIKYATIKRRIYVLGWNDVDAITIGDGRIEKQRSN